MVKIHAPELEPFAAWLNTPRPIRMKDLRGHVVILDFWTYCCVNCMHVLPVLRDLEVRRANDPLVVIGVHSAKFETESHPDRIHDAMARHEVHHPVVVDRDMALWERFAVRSWPTLVFIKPDGTIAAVAPGEPDPDVLDRFVQRLLDEARADGTLAAQRLDFTVPVPADAHTLAFPGKVSIAHDGFLAVSDSGHHRVLVLAPDGRVQETIGSGLRGLRDGAFEHCAFDDPQGIAWDGDALWIADTRNHAIRRADLRTRTVQTIAGNGTMAATLFDGRARGAEISLRSPWDLVMHDGRVLIAMAGAHQLWSLDPATHEIGPFAGSGREALVDGALHEAAFAQPSGLALHGHLLYVADSETSAVRVVDLEKNEVRTVMGEGLFDYGDVDGPLASARLQHALDVTVTDDGALIVADTYNDRLRRIDLTSERVGTFFREHEGLTLREPAGIAVDARGDLIVADTNHHRLVRVHSDGLRAEEIPVTGVHAPQRGDVPVSRPARASAQSDPQWFTDAPEPAVGHGFREGDCTLSLTFAPPQGWKLAEGSTVRAVIEVSRRSDLLSIENSTRGHTVRSDAHVVFPFEAYVSKLPTAEIPSEVLVTVDAVLCRDGSDGQGPADVTSTTGQSAVTEQGAATAEGAVCVPARAWFRLPLTLAREADRVLGYHLVLRPPLDG